MTNERGPNPKKMCSSCHCGVVAGAAAVYCQSG